MPRVRVSKLHVIIFSFTLAGMAFASEPASQPSLVNSDEFTADVTQFLRKELAAHVEAVKTLNPPQAIVLGVGTGGDFTDRKSTRLNSSHTVISYAVFCL